MKISGHVAPMATPRDIIAILNKLPCHHFRVNDLNMFIGLFYHKNTKSKSAANLFEAVPNPNTIRNIEYQI